MTDKGPRIAALYRYPMKGLSGERLDEVRLAAGGTFPLDRAFAIENGPSGFDVSAPRHLPKTAFLMLMRNERLAQLVARYDDASGNLTISRGGEPVAEGCLETAQGRRAIEAFFDDFTAADLRGHAKVLHAPGHSFSDTPEKCASLINLESVRDLGRRLGVEVHPLRFRGNIYVDGLPAWSELEWAGRQVAIGGLSFEALARIDRCAATNVDPETAERDLAIPRSLLELYDHGDCGVYLKVVRGGALRVGDTLSLAESSPDPPLSS